MTEEAFVVVRLSERERDTVSRTSSASICFCGSSNPTNDGPFGFAVSFTPRNPNEETSDDK